MGATRVQHLGKGMASRLRTVMCDHAHNTQGFQYAIIQSINQVTRHIYVDKMGGKELRIADLRTWIWNKNGDGGYGCACGCIFDQYRHPHHTHTRTHTLHRRFISASLSSPLLPFS